MTNIVNELRRSPTAGDRKMADLLSSLLPAAGGYPRPRATEELATFIAEQDARLTLSAHGCGHLAAPNLVVVLAPRPGPRAARPLSALARGLTRTLVPAALWGKVVLAATVALAAGAVVSGGSSHDVVVPPTDGSTATRPATPTLPSSGAVRTPPASQATPPSGLRGHPTGPVPTAEAEDKSATPVSSPKTQHASTGADSGADTSEDTEAGDGGSPGDGEVEDDGEVGDGAGGGDDGAAADDSKVADDSRVAGDGGPDREPASSLDD
jgi:hypothetical protein